MHANALRKILLVKSVEDQDADGAVLTLAERDAATRDALRADPAGTDAATTRRTGSPRLAGASTAGRDELYGRLVAASPGHRAHGDARIACVASRARRAAGRVRVRPRCCPCSTAASGSRSWRSRCSASCSGTSRSTRCSPSRRCDGRDRARRRALADAAGWAAWPLRWGWRRAAGLVRQAVVLSPAAGGRVASVFGRLVAARATAARAAGQAPLSPRRGCGRARPRRGTCTCAGSRSNTARAGRARSSTPTQVRGVLNVLYGAGVGGDGHRAAGRRRRDRGAALAWRERRRSGRAVDPPDRRDGAVVRGVAAAAARDVAHPCAAARLARVLAPPESLLAYARAVLGASDAAPRAGVGARDAVRLSARDGESRRPEHAAARGLRARCAHGTRGGRRVRQ